jgi:hypothetical protein
VPLKTAVATPTAIAKLSSMLEDRLAERTMIHAVLMDVLGLGVLIAGSGIGRANARWTSSSAAIASWRTTPSRCAGDRRPS